MNLFKNQLYTHTFLDYLKMNLRNIYQIQRQLKDS